MQKYWDINDKVISNKKIYIIIAIIFVTIILLTTIFYFINQNNKENNYTTLTSSDQKFTIELPNTIKYRQNSAPNNDFTIDLYSENDEMFMYATTISKVRELSLYDVANDDKTSYFKDKENLRDDSRYFGN